MQSPFSRGAIASTLVVLASTLPAAPAGEVKGSFVLGGTDAKLAHVRAARATLDAKGMKGYSVLLSARPAEGPLDAWRTADPGQRGSFMFIQLDASGEVWVAELGHAARKGGRFGVVTELVKRSFAVTGDRLSARVGTDGEQEFGGDRYSVDLTFAATLEGAAGK
jgi:hypothetical protein